MSTWLHWRNPCVGISIHGKIFDCVEIGLVSEGGLLPTYIYMQRGSPFFLTLVLGTSRALFFSFILCFMITRPFIFLLSFFLFPSVLWEPLRYIYIYILSTTECVFLGYIQIQSIYLLYLLSLFFGVRKLIMEKGKQVGASSSSFTMDLFGPKDSSKSSSSSSSLFGSVFGPSSTVGVFSSPFIDHGVFPY